MTAASKRAAWHAWANRVTVEAWEQARHLPTPAERFAEYERLIAEARKAAVKDWPEAPEL